MDPNQQGYSQYNDQQLQKEHALQVWKERIYRFFYNIWPALQQILMFVFYHTMRIVRGFFRTALESFKGGG